MSAIRKFKWFWAWDDEKEEAWLEKMSRAGLHLQSITMPGYYIFFEGKPKNYIYRLDFVTDRKDYTNYMELFKDAGWEHLFEHGLWQYFRTEAVSGQIPEIYSDNESKIAKYARIMMFLVPFFPIYSFLLNTLNKAEGLFYGILTFVFFLIMLIYAYAMVMLIRRIGRLRKKI